MRGIIEAPAGKHTPGDLEMETQNTLAVNLLEAQASVEVASQGLPAPYLPGSISARGLSV